jgi:hypothetical protein
MKDLNLIKLTLVEDGNTAGYDTEEIKQKLGDELFNAFNRWYAGKTGAIISGKYCVYPSDWELYVRLRTEAANKMKGATK